MMEGILAGVKRDPRFSGYWDASRLRFHVREVPSLPQGEMGKVVMKRDGAGRFSDVDIVALQTVFNF